jgi:putative NADPH-quinone reductase
MRILVILGHPEPNSFNHAIAATVCTCLREDRHEVIFHDLYLESFDPILPKEEIPENGPVPDIIRQHCEQLQSADGIVIVHPNWWGQPPAILKGWIDRVIRPGIAYRFEEGDSGDGVPIGLMKAKAALVINTSNTPDHREQAVFGDPLQALWKQCIFDLSGVPAFHRRMFNVIITSTLAERSAWLDEVKQMTRDIFAECKKDD